MKGWHVGAFVTPMFQEPVESHELASVEGGKEAEDIAAADRGSGDRLSGSRVAVRTRFGSSVARHMVSASSAPAKPAGLTNA